MKKLIFHFTAISQTIYLPIAEQKI